MSNSIVKTITKEQLIESVKRWTLIDSQIKLVNEKMKLLREEKRKHNETICKYMETNSLTNNKIGISDGELSIYEKTEYSSLTYSYLEECLDKLIPDKEKVAYIINYLKENREVTKSLDIRRTVTPLRI
jgi:hypothetical protein